MCIYVYKHVCFTTPPTQVPKKWNPLWMIMLMSQQCGMQWTSLRREKLGLIINMWYWQGFMHPCTQLSQATDIHVHLRHQQLLLWCLHFRAKSRSDVSCKFITNPTCMCTWCCHQSWQFFGWPPCLMCYNVNLKVHHCFYIMHAMSQTRTVCMSSKLEVLINSPHVNVPQCQTKDSSVSSCMHACHVSN